MLLQASSFFTLKAASILRIGRVIEEFLKNILFFLLKYYIFGALRKISLKDSKGD